MHLNKYKQSDGTILYKGVVYENGIDFYHRGIFGFCGCGDPTSNMRYILGILELLYKRSMLGEGEPKNWENHTKELIGYFKSYQEMNFVLYVLDKLGVIDHGTNIRGSFVDYDDGVDMLEDLRELLKGGPYA